MLSLCEESGRAEPPGLRNWDSAFLAAVERSADSYRINVRVSRALAVEWPEKPAAMASSAQLAIYSGNPVVDGEDTGA